ncbi:MAG: hypothetical protein NZR01_16520 [Bryobacteraceae bacterium]|nr:hypothetical protein [Bryobacteraceae bacterium]
MRRRMGFLMLAAALAAPAAFADRAERAERVKAEMAGKVVKATFTDSARAAVRAYAALRGKGGLRKAASEREAQMPMAPGVVQINLFDSGREAFFVLTEPLPAGSLVQAFIIPPDNEQEWALEALRADQALPAGYSFYLPGIKTLGDFWQTGLTTYMVIVSQPGKPDSMSALDFSTKGYFRDIIDVDYLVPGINWWRQFWSGNNHWLEIKGRFLTNTKTYVVFEDIVVPQSAIRVENAETIYVNLSQVPNFDLTLMKGYLLTVGQDGWTDTAPFRFTPLR